MEPTDPRLSVFDTPPPPPRLSDLIPQHALSRHAGGAADALISDDDDNNIDSDHPAVATESSLDDESDEDVCHDEDASVDELVLDCYSKDYRNTIVTNPDENLAPRDIIFSFLLSTRVSNLKGPHGELNRHRQRQDVCKQTMVCMIMRVVSKAVAAGGGAISFDDGIVFKKGDAQRWLDGNPGEHALFMAPTDELLEKYYPYPPSTGASKRKTAARGATGTFVAAASFTSNEFARTVGLLTGNEAVRAALLRSGLDLTRSELDKGVGRDDFWNAEMEPMFNDKRLDVSAPCAVDALVMSRVDANSTPLDHRPAELLRRKFFEAGAYFTRVYDNWSVSGQNDAENFTEFVKAPSNGS
jgi:hypothetical protein